MKIYVASSWRNEHYDEIVKILNKHGHEVYDFRKSGFDWGVIDKDWENWTLEQWMENRNNPTAMKFFKKDMEAMEWADVCVLVLPCGRSAHLEAGWFVGNGKWLYILQLGDERPELMYHMANSLGDSIDSLLLAMMTIPRLDR